MIKLFRVTRAELLKQFSKVGTWIILGVIVLYCLGVGAIALINNANNYEDSFARELENIDFQLEHLDEEWEWMTFESEAEKALFAQELQQRRADLEQTRAQYLYLMELGVQPGEWRACAYLDQPAVEEVSGPVGLGLIDEAGMKDLIERQDWPAYMALLIRAAELDQSASIASGDENALPVLLRLLVEKDLRETWATDAVSEIRNMNDSNLMAQEQIDALSGKTAVERYQSRLLQESIAAGEQRIRIARYRLENGVAPVAGDDFVSFLLSYASPSVLILIVILLMSTSVCTEFTSGTIKIFAITPYKRWKLLYGKFAAVMVLALGYLLVQYAILSVFGLLTQGLPTGGHFVDVWFDRIVVLSPAAAVGLHLLDSINCLLVVASFAMTIACLIRNGVWTAVITLGTYFLGNTAMAILAFIPHPVALAGRFWLFANTSLMQYSALPVGSASLPGLSFGFSLITLAVYMTVFHVASFFAFSKRPINT